MTTAPWNSFRPGFFCTFIPKEGESFRGYMLRLASQNFLSGINDVLAVVRADVEAPIRSAIDLRTNFDALQVFGVMATGSRDGVTRFFAEPLGDAAVFVEGCRVDKDALMDGLAQVCPRCLVEEPYAKAEWDIAANVSCPKHRVFLVDHCQNCDSSLEWGRPHLLHCQSCGADVRFFETHTAPTALLSTCEDYSALAPFRLLHEGRESETVAWDTAFQLLKAAALTPVDYCEERYPAKFFRELPALKRVTVLSRFASARQWNGYQADVLKNLYFSQFAHLAVISSETLIPRYVERFLVSNAGMLRMTVALICFGAEPKAIGSAALLFSGRPPALVTISEVESFLGADEETVKGLQLLGRLSPIGQAHEGYDIDELVDCCRYIKEDLLGLPAIAQILGVPIDWEDLRRNRILRPWNPRAQSDYRVDVEHVANLQNRLFVTLSALERPPSPIRLGTIMDGRQSSCSVILNGITLLLSGALRFGNWGGHGYEWSKIEVDRSEVALILGVSSG